MEQSLQRFLETPEVGIIGIFVLLNTGMSSNLLPVTLVFIQ